MKRISFEGNAFAEFTAWSNEDKRVFQKIATLLEECRRTPFHGIGKPEPLKHGAYRGYWSAADNRGTPFNLPRRPMKMSLLLVAKGIMGNKHRRENLGRLFLNLIVISPLFQ
jgi:Txe/YoeB family toxin of toxin-antitoxin system